LKKLMLMGAMLAAVLVAAAPALAQVSQPFSERRITSGTASPKTEISNKGDNVNLCPTSQQAAQTGNVANEQGVNQYRTKTDDIDFSGSEISLTPDATGTCTQTIEQKTAPPPAPPPPSPPPPSPPPSPTPPSPPPAPAVVGQLPATGGIAGSASLLGLGAGILLVAGGLIARRIIR
jgi:LPXTG-motif cell wall-anchored protein